MVVRLGIEATPVDVSPPGVSVRSRVHEYGGGAFWAEGSTFWYTGGADQGLWRLEVGGAANLITPVAPPGETHRYADARLVAGGQWLVAVRERHHDGQIDDEVVAVPSDGRAAPTVLMAGRDFFAAPRPSPDGRSLAWLCWDLPNMPWDGSELYVADLRTLREAPQVGEPCLVAGGPHESVAQPTWTPDGKLLFVSDANGWWQPHMWAPSQSGVAPTGAQGDLGTRSAGNVSLLCDQEIEFHGPDWALGQSTFALLPGGEIVLRYRKDMRDHVGVLLSDGSLSEIDQPCVSISGICAMGEQVAVLGSTPDAGAAVHLIEADSNSEDGPASWQYAGALYRPFPPPVDVSWVSVAEPHDFETSDGSIAHLLFYPPAAQGIQGPSETRPPLVVVCHGGPTGGVESGLDLTVQMWTSRGVAVAAVDYRGSSGHGRVYRCKLDGAWGVADAEDVVYAAQYLADVGLVDGERMAVRGSSAGGLTALRALSISRVFGAAVVAYGVSDLESLARETHKFESGYLDRLIGPWPTAAELYRERSPACHPERIQGAVLLLQGSDDPVVPPAQASKMASALRGRGVRCEHVVFEGEGHGFRAAATLEEAVRLELEFVADVLKF